jgi:hypothetical protein
VDEKKMSKQPPRTLVDKSSYEEMVGECLNEVDEQGEILSDPTSVSSSIPAASQRAAIQAQFSLFAQNWFRAMFVLCLLSLGLFSFSRLNSEPVTNRAQARLELQAKLGTEFPAVNSMLDFLESDSTYYGPGDPEFTQKLTKLNKALSADEEDFRPLNAQLFEFRGNELVYVEK